jgi:hypothetical protein
MINKIKKSVLLAITTLMMVAPAGVAGFGAVAFADATGNNIADQVCTGSNAAGGTSSQGVNCGGTSGSLDFGGIAKKIVNIFSIIVGAVAIIMIIYGGFRYITSGGDSGSVGNAKNTLIYAIVGLIIVALAQVLVHFVINTATSSVTSGSQ